MPRRSKRPPRKHVRENHPTKTLTEYFPPSPPADNNNVENSCCGLQITSETVFYNGPSEEERLEAKRIPHSFTATVPSLPTPDDSPKKSDSLVKEEPRDLLELPMFDQKSLSSDSGASLTSNTESSSSKSGTRARSTKSIKTKTKKEETVHNRHITEFFPVRKSSRKTAKELQREQEETIRRKILEGCEDGLKISYYEGKGRGIEATRPFSRGEFIVQYAGDLVELKEARSREETYKKDTSYGCYMYFFNHKGKSYCVDATQESGKLGRLLNHSRTKPNCVTKTIDIESNPFLILVAARDIEVGEELVYDYGERSKEAVESNPWLRD